jgi:hypothetical protein
MRKLNITKKDNLRKYKRVPLKKKNPGNNEDESSKVAKKKSNSKTQPFSVKLIVRAYVTGIDVEDILYSFRDEIDPEINTVDQARRKFKMWESQVYRELSTTRVKSHRRRKRAPKSGVDNEIALEKQVKERILHGGRMSFDTLREMMLTVLENSSTLPEKPTAEEYGRGWGKRFCERFGYTLLMITTIPGGYKVPEIEYPWIRFKDRITMAYDKYLDCKGSSSSESSESDSESSNGSQGGSTSGSGSSNSRSGDSDEGSDSEGSESEGSDSEGSDKGRSDSSKENKHRTSSTKCELEESKKNSKSSAKKRQKKDHHHDNKHHRGQSSGNHHGKSNKKNRKSKDRNGKTKSNRHGKSEDRNGKTKSNRHGKSEVRNGAKAAAKSAAPSNQTTSASVDDVQSDGNIVDAVAQNAGKGAKAAAQVAAALEAVTQTGKGAKAAAKSAAQSKQTNSASDDDQAGSDNEVADVAVPKTGKGAKAAAKSAAQSKQIISASDDDQSGSDGNVDLNVLAVKASKGRQREQDPDDESMFSFKKKKTHYGYVSVVNNSGLELLCSLTADNMFPSAAEVQLLLSLLAAFIVIAYICTWLHACRLSITKQ